jgi:hypothetical protein
VPTARRCSSSRHSHRFTVKKSRSISHVSIIHQFADTFTGIRCMPDEHQIVIDPSVQPVAHPARRVSLALQPKLKKLLDSLEQSGIIIKREEPTDWVNSFLLIEKSDKLLKVVLDPRDLNRALTKRVASQC